MDDSLRIAISVALFIIVFTPFYRYFDRQEERIRREWPDGWKKRLMLGTKHTGPIAGSQEPRQKDH